MNMEYFKMFVSVVNQGSISKVAEIMNISQSALSQQMKAMEKLWGVRLLERTNKGVTLTPVGEVVYRNAVKLTTSYEQMLQEISETQDKNRTLRIIATPVVYSYALPCTLYHVKKKFPTYTLEIGTMDSQKVEDTISQGFFDIGFIVGKPKNDKILSKKVFSGKVYLVAGDTLDIPDQITRDDIYKYPLLMFSKSQKTRQILDHYLKKIGIDINQLHILYNLDSTESIKVSAIKGYGLAFLPYTAIKKELYNKQLRIIKMDSFDFENHYYAIKKQTSEHTDLDLLKITAYIEKFIEDTIC